MDFSDISWFWTSTVYTSVVISPSPSVDLSQLHTFGLPALASRVETFEDTESLQRLLKETAPPHLILGDGSNVAFIGDFQGTVLLNRIMGKKVLGKKDTGKVEILAGAGEEWHQLVLWSLNENLFGLENLSLIPGRAGAAPIQNIGAYGVELADIFLECEVFDRQKDEIRWIKRDECDFGYRNSIFKKNKERFVILQIKLELNSSFHPNLSYGGLKEKAQQVKVELSGESLSRIVCEIREKKLPHPCELGNAGSFFKNPVIDTQLKNQLQDLEPSPPLYDVGEGYYKTSAAWLIDQCGLKGAHEGSIAVHEGQPLVLVNRGGGTGKQLLTLASRIGETVFEKFGVALEREVNLIPLPEEKAPS